MSKLKDECEEILREFIVKHQFLNPECPEHDIWSKQDAIELCADLIQVIRESSILEEEITKNDWGK